jgi:hypothetical protein
MTGQTEFDDLALALIEHGAKRAQMMGRPMLAIGGRMFACLDNGMLGLRLGADTQAHADALEIAGSALFSPGEKGRVFRDWVALPASRAEHWEPFAVAAMAHVAG